MVGKNSTTIRISVDGEMLEQVEEFKYLGTLLSANGYSEKDIRVWIGMAKRLFCNIKAVVYGRLDKI